MHVLLCSQFGSFLASGSLMSGSIVGSLEFCVGKLGISPANSASWLTMPMYVMGSQLHCRRVPDLRLLTIMASMLVWRLDSWSRYSRIPTYSWAGSRATSSMTSHLESGKSLQSSLTLYSKLCAVSFLAVAASLTHRKVSQAKLIKPAACCVNVVDLLRKPIDSRHGPHRVRRHQWRHRDLPGR